MIPVLRLEDKQEAKTGNVICVRQLLRVLKLKSSVTRVFHGVTRAPLHGISINGAPLCDGMDCVMISEMMAPVRHIGLSISLFTEKESRMLNAGCVYDEKRTEAALIYFGEDCSRISIVILEFSKI